MQNQDQKNRVEAVLTQSQGFNVSERYSPIKTQEIVDRFVSHGFAVESISVAKPRKASKETYQKHLIRLSHPEMVLRGVGDSRPEIVLINSHDASTSLKMMIGIYRLVCSNGLIVGKTFEGVSIRHVGDVLPKIDKGISDLTERLPLVAESINRLQGKVLTDSEALSFADQASKLILPESTISVNLDSALRVKRQGDASQDLWTVYNRLQETLLRGGLRFVTRNETKDDQGNVIDVSIRNNTSRPVRSIDRQVSINRDLWSLAESLAA